MTYEEAMTAVKANQASPPERRGCGGRTAARRPAWANDPDRSGCGVIFKEIFVREANTHDEAYEWQLLLNHFSSDSPKDWGLEVNAGPWWPSDEDEHANDWEIYEVWS